MNAATLLPLIPALPLAGFVALALTGARWPRAAVAWVGCGTVGASALLTAVVAFTFPGETSASADPAITRTLWTWLTAEGFSAGIGLRLDALSLLMSAVITGVGFLIHVYSAEFMSKDDGYSRFFAYLNLFVCAMLLLVLADNLVLLLLGWEGVGLCSYLLIGFWYREPANGAAARKAFIVTRVGDTALLIGMFMLFDRFGTLHIGEILREAPTVLAPGSTTATWIAALLLGGAVGKSAQLPLQTWLPDAMAGPSPVSALIHAATMVTAGVYLIARHHLLFELAPAVMTAVAIVGALTLLLAGFSALAQHDLKRVLAYSTISQIGYMFLALGVGAWTAAMFHFMTHAFFKALLFLAAGAVIHALADEHDMHRMGGLRTRLPLVFWTFLAGAAALAALPLITAGFYSKDLILFQAWTSPHGGPWLWGAGIIGALVTALYTGRMLSLTFFGKAHTEVSHRPGPLMTVPMVVLAALSLAGGFVETPHTLGGVTVFSHFLASTLPSAAHAATGMTQEIVLQLAATVAVLLGLGAAAHLHRHPPEASPRLTGRPAPQAIGRLWLAGWGFDWLYDRMLVRPFIGLARLNRRDVLDRIYDGIAAICRAFHRSLSATQTGLVRRYAMSITVGAIVLLLIAVFL
ncbi:MAG TPA: NADH-quinone oxidoreductase subunit L [Opitutaceae bacterium]